MRTWAGVVLLGLVACADDDLAKRIDALQQRVDTLEAKGPAAGPAAAQRPGGPDEKAAADLFRKAAQAAGTMDYDTARAALTELKAKYPDSRPAKSTARLQQDLDAVGKPAQPLAVASAYQGTAPDLGAGKASLIVFFGPNSPQAKDQLARVQTLAGKYAGAGLQTVGVVEKTTEPDAVPALLQSAAISFPVVRQEGTTASDYYVTSGVPTAVLVQGGRVIWHGAPARLNEALLDRVLGLASAPAAGAEETPG